MQSYSKFIKSLPVIPDVAAKVLGMAEDKLDISFRELEEIIKIDPGLSAKILKVANSALYARQKEIKSLQMAITMLGFRNIRSLVLLVTASNMFTKEKQSEFYQFFWKHSIINAFMTKDMADRTRNRQLADECFLAGLLHDIGQVALHNSDQEKYQEVLSLAGSRGTRISEVERGRFDSDHKEVGAAVLREWSFPDVYVHAALEHGSPNITSSHKQVVLLVSVADFVTSNIDIYTESPLPLSLMRDVYIQTGLREEDLLFYQNEFLGSLREEPLFNECQTLFNLEPIPA